MSEEAKVQTARDLAMSIDEAMRPQRFAAGYAARPANIAKPVELPPWFIDSCRRAYLSVPFDEPCRVVGVTSALHGEGKTSVAMGIATAIASDTQESTLLMECDLERPSFHRYFNIPAEGGLSEWLDGAASLRVVRVPYLANQVVIPSGAPQSDPARLLYQLTETGVISELKPYFRNIVLDLPPMLDIAYTSLASKLADKMLVVARYGVTHIKDLEKVLFLLGHERVNGIVLNATDFRTPSWLRKLL
jgi:Mrp family chromosome partitioning ATPase